MLWFSQGKKAINMFDKEQKRCGYIKGKKRKKENERQYHKLLQAEKTWQINFFEKKRKHIYKGKEREGKG